MFVGAQPTNSSCIIERGHRRSVLGIIVVASLLSGFLSSVPASAQTLEQWRDELSQIPQPQKRLTATYPSNVWQEIACTTPPAYPQTPKSPTPSPLPSIGNGTNAWAEVSGSISSVLALSIALPAWRPRAHPLPTRDHQSPTPIRSNSTPTSSPAGSAQLSERPFGCQGWQQFVFENNGSGARAYIQFWLLRYNTTCPAGEGWNQFSFTGSRYLLLEEQQHGGSGRACPADREPGPAKPDRHVSQVGIVSPCRLAAMSTRGG